MTSIAMRHQRCCEQKIPLVDLRDRDAYVQFHLIGSSHFPRATIGLRWHQLPPKGTNLALIDDADCLTQSAAMMEAHGYPVSEQFSSEDLAANPELCESGSQSARLWRAAPILETHHKQLLQLVPEAQPLKAIDLGCGSGRDAVFLAARGWQVTALDYLDKALQQTRQLAADCGETVTPLKLDLNESAKMRNLIESAPPSLFHISRYLNRELFQSLNEHAKPGSIISIQTFRLGAAAFGKPRREEFLLANKEPESLFDNFRIVRNTTVNLADGRPVCEFIALKSL